MFNESTSTVDTTAETFLTAGLSKVLKINNICSNDNLTDCGIPDKIITLDNINVNLSDIDTLVKYNEMFNGSYSNDLVSMEYHQQDTKAAAFETANGESILTYYNPNCQGNMGETTTYSTQPKMCANFIYDLNGRKGPNTMGKDIGFITIMYPTDSIVVAPIPLSQNYANSSVPTDSLSSLCRSQDSESRVPNIDEATAMFYNRKLITSTTLYYYCTSSMLSGTQTWRQGFHTGYRLPVNKGDNYNCYLRCIKR